MQAWRKNGSPAIRLALRSTHNVASGLLVPLKNRIIETMLMFARNQAKQTETLNAKLTVSAICQVFQVLLVNTNLNNNYSTLQHSY
jgi:hypothetical protein